MRFLLLLVTVLLACLWGGDSAKRGRKQLKVKPTQSGDGSWCRVVVQEDGSDLTGWRQDEDGVFFYIAALPQNATDEQIHDHRKLYTSRKRNAESQQQKKLKRQAAEQEPIRRVCANGWRNDGTTAGASLPRRDG